MSGFFGAEPVDVVATWVAALVTIAVFGGLFGERRVFGWTQHLFAGLVTGFLALLAVTEVIGTRLVEPILAGGAGRVDLWLGLALVAATAAAPWLPRPVAAVPVSIAIGALAAFAFGGAVVGTILPQLAAAVDVDGATPVSAAIGIISAGITALVLLGFLHGVPRGRSLALATTTGRWLLIAGIGGWLGYLLVARLVLLIDRIGFLLGEWLGVLP